jgi:glutathione S-transferase
LRGAVGPLARAVLPIFSPLVSRLIRRRYRISSESSMRSYQRIQAVFDQVGEALRDGRRFLVGDRFSAADLTFAALSVPALLPAESGAPMPRLEELPSEMAAAIGAFRRSAAGEFALRLYRAHRQTGSGRDMGQP